VLSALRVIVGCTHGDEDPDRVVVSYLTAGAALDEAQLVEAELNGATPLMQFAGEGAMTFTY
jgi:hypothetical protein